MNIVQLYQAGIGMGDRDYYLLEDEGSAKMRDAYRAYINKLFTLAGSSPEQADAAVDAVMKIEKAIAEISYGLRICVTPRKTIINCLTRISRK